MKLESLTPFKVSGRVDLANRKTHENFGLNDKELKKRAGRGKGKAG